MTRRRALATTASALALPLVASGCSRRREAEQLQGPSGFTVTGNFKDWDRWADLARLGMPTPLLVGRCDTMSVADIRHMGSLIPRSQLATCERGRHL